MHSPMTVWLQMMSLAQSHIWPQSSWQEEECLQLLMCTLLEF